MATTNSSFRATQWDPVLILSQIVCLQAVWYISISVIVFILFRFSGADITLDAILNYREIRADNAQGMLLGLAWLLNSIVGVYLLLKIVARARLVLDFSLTLLFHHVIVTTYYSDHIPTSFLWWALNGTTAGIMVFGGEYVCMQQEMEPIILGGGQQQTGSGSNGGGSSSNNSSSIGNTNASGVGSSTNSSNISGHHLSLQGAALSGMHDGYGVYDESAGLLMDTFDSTSTDPSSHGLSASSSRAMPHKARSSEDAGRVVRGGFAPGVRNSILGGQNHGRQRTSDGYKAVPSSEADGH
ncbi:hypothetical protein BGZ46_005383 [Entomortierella lignicola]|nr:hypothetical protein BGZ46_005383 [Entomortierella lignicola]